MNLRTTFFCIIACLLAFACGSDDPTENNNGGSMGKVSVAIAATTTDEAFVSATISGVSSASSIEDYGFIYSDDPVTSTEQGTKVSLGQPGSLGTFEHTLTNLFASEAYSIKAYIVEKGKTVLSDEKNFITKSYNTWFAQYITNSPALNPEEFHGIQLAVNGKGYIGFGTKNGTNTTIPLYEYNPQTLTITALATCPAPHYLYTRRFVVGNNIYLISKDNATWRYDITQNSWSQLNDFPTTLSPAYGFNFDGDGWMLAHNNSTMSLELWVYNPGTDSWTKDSTVDLKTVLIHEAYGVTAVGNKIYIVAALAGGEPKLFEYTPSTDTYTKLTTPEFTLPEGSVTDTYVLTADGIPYFVNMASKEIWSYSVSEDSWTILPPPIAASRINLFAINNELHIASNAVLRYDVE